MARLPDLLRGQPAYGELRLLMREGLCLSAALRCKQLRSSPKVRELIGDAKSSPEKQSQALLEILEDELDTGEVTAILPSQYLHQIFPKGPAEDLLTDRRIEVCSEVPMSDSTLTRREFSVSIALLACLGLLEPAPSSAAPEVNADRRISGLDGEWFALWETHVHGETNFNMEKIVLSARGSHLDIRNVAPSPHNREGYLWTGRLEALQTRVLAGSYWAIDPTIGYSGTLFYTLGPPRTFMEGKWVGANVDLPAASGITVLAREQEVARQRFKTAVGGSLLIPYLD